MQVQAGVAWRLGWVSALALSGSCLRRGVTGPVAVPHGAGAVPQWETGSEMLSLLPMEMELVWN